MRRILHCSYTQRHGTVVTVLSWVRDQVDCVHVETCVGQEPGGFKLDAQAETARVKAQFEGMSMPYRVVAYAHLGREDVEEQLKAQSEFGCVSGIRMIMNWDDEDSSLRWVTFCTNACHISISSSHCYL